MNQPSLCLNQLDVHVEPLAEEKSSLVSPPQERPSCWPNELETLLLQAGLCAPPQAIAAWNEFCRRIPNIEELNDASYRLFPLVGGNLQNCDAPVLHRNRIAGVLRHAWTRNQQLFCKTVPLLRALQAQGIELLLLKGAALIDLYRKQGSVRPMADLDVLIHPHDLRRALELLQKMGCTTDLPVTPQRLLELINFRHEVTVRTAEGADLDIHWYLVADTRHLEAEDFFWRDAVSCSLASFAGRTLHPTDQLLHTCLHGAQWNEVSPVRWLADAMMLIREGVDWPRLEKQARRLERLQPVRETLLFLDQLGMNLPPAILEHWRALDITEFEKREGGYRAHRPQPCERTKQLAWSYLRLHRSEAFGGVLRRAPAYMRQIHHFRAYSRKFAFFIYLIYFFCRSRARSSSPAH